MNNQLEKLQQKPRVRPFRPVTIQLNKKNKLNTELSKDDAKEKNFTQKIIDKTNDNIDRTELLKRFNLSKNQTKKKIETPQVIERDNTIISKLKENGNELTKEIEENDKLLSSVREIIETSNVIRSSKEDIEKEGENIEREYDLEMEQKIQTDNPGEQDNRDDVIWNTNSISFFPKDVPDVLPTIYEEEETHITKPNDTQEKPKKHQQTTNKKVNNKIRTTLQEGDENVEEEDNEHKNEDNEMDKQPKTNVKKVLRGRSKTTEGNMVNINDTNDLEEYKQFLQPLGGINEIQRHQSYYLSNRKYFLNFINNIFLKYRDQLNEERSMINCENIMSNNVRKFSLLLHQNLIVDYLNIYTPYRGLLFYHGLGSGKTCSSIAIAEGFKTTRKVYVMLPASLEDNYLKEIKKCGDYLYKKNQYWTWIPVESESKASNAFEKLMSVPLEFLRKYKGAFFVDVNKPPNYNKMTIEDKKLLTRQIDAMISNKYNFLHYNGLNMKKFNELTKGGTINPFDDSVVIIDEAHNFVSLIVNKLKVTKPVTYDKNGNLVTEPVYLSLKMYELLLNAVNIRLVLLTGTPIINYPNEVGILFNILRGYIKTWNIPLSVENKKWSNDEIRELFKKSNNIDYLHYDPSSKIITVTRNPYGFENTFVGDDNSEYNGVTNEKRQAKTPYGKTIYRNKGEITDDSFIQLFLSGLTKNDIKFDKSKVTIEKYKALPDNYDEFMEMFSPEESTLGIQKKARGEKLLNTSRPVIQQSKKKTGENVDVFQVVQDKKLEIKNSNLFKRRIVGLTSYFRSAQEELLPSFDRSTDYFVVKIDMSEYQFKLYETARAYERKIDKKSKSPGDVFKTQTSSYRIFSRLFCNFVMPTEIPRPVPFDTSEKSDKESKVPKKTGVPKPVETTEGSVPKKTRVPKPVETTEGSVPKKRGRPKKVVGGSKKSIRDDTYLDIEGERGIIDNDVEEDTVEEDEESDEMDTDDVVVEEEKVNDAMEDEDYIEPEVRNESEDIDVDNGENETFDDEGIDMEYSEMMKRAFQEIEEHKERYLSLDTLKIYSPKFAVMIETLQNPNNIGLNLIYSQFRTFEGIGLFTLALQVAGYAQFKIAKNENGEWDLNMSDEDMTKPKYALYTGKEDPIEKDIIRNIYNGDWDGGDVPKLIVSKLKRINVNNNLGEIIKILMITASGSEGINLRNTRYVHIMEPYWNPIRIQQIIGRSRRICSHYRLPKDLQNVQVYVYVMQFSPKQKTEASIELKLNDISKFNSKNIITTDEALYEITTIKETFNEQYIKAIKESSIDCSVYIDMNSKEGLRCMSHPSANKLEYLYTPNILKDETDANLDKNIYKITWKGIPVEINSKMYIMKKGDNPYKQELYDFENYKQKNLILVGYAVKEKKGSRVSPPYFIPI
jgi:hypothetical protein